MKRNCINLKQLSAPMAVGFGTVVAVVLGLLLIIAMSYLTVNEHIMLEAITMIIPVAQFFAMLLGGVVTAKTSVNKAGIIPLMTCLAFILILLVGNVLFVEEGMKLTAGSVVAFISAAGACLLITMNKGRRGKTKIRSR